MPLGCLPAACNIRIAKQSSTLDFFASLEILAVLKERCNAADDMALCSTRRYGQLCGAQALHFFTVITQVARVLMSSGLSEGWGGMGMRPHLPLEPY
jgi:hypothetical protein